MKKINVFLFLLTTSMLFAVEPGGIIESGVIRSRSVPVVSAAPAKGYGYQVIVFMDATSREALSCFRMLDELSSRMGEYPEAERADFFVLACNSKRIIKETLNGLVPSYGVGSDEKRILFNEFVPGEILFPVSLIVKKGKVLWKGNPIDLESVLTLIHRDKFDSDRQVKVERIRKEMQMAIQASLPDVVVRCADDILKLQPGDAIAVRAKLYVYENTGRFRDAVAFTRKNAEDNPDDVNQTLLYLEYLRRQGNSSVFASEFRVAVERFTSSSEALFRILGFYVNGVPFGWVSPTEAAAVSDKIRSTWGNQSEMRQARYYVYDARVRYMLCDLDGAIKSQEEALKLLSGKNDQKDARQILDYYRSISRKK